MFLAVLQSEKMGRQSRSWMALRYEPAVSAHSHPGVGFDSVASAPVGSKVIILRVRLVCAQLWEREIRK